MAYINRNTYIFIGMVQDNIALNGACPGEMIEKALAIARAVIKQPDIFLIDEALTVLIHQRKRRF